jgi:NAD(P)-dependent dehydrogenase (short-subunit alcohol dehydrogenase family)
LNHHYYYYYSENHRRPLIPNINRNSFHFQTLSIINNTTMSTTPRHGALLIFGSGPGIGVHVASRFARGGFQKVVLLSRNATRLSDDAFMVWSIAPEVEVSTVCVDLTSASDLQDALRRIEDVLGDTAVECVYYNAARVEPTSLLGESAEDLRANLEVGFDQQIFEV